MQVERQDVVALLTSRGYDREAAAADEELPDPVDLDRDAGLLTKFGVHPSDLSATDS